MFGLFDTGARLKTLEEALRQATESLEVAEAIFEDVQAVMVTDARRRIQKVNRAFCQMMGYSPEEVIGKTPWMFRSGHHDADFYAAMVRSVEESGHFAGEIWDRHKNGSVFPKWMSITAVKNAKGEIHHFVASYLDLRERKEAEERIHELAFYDLLTRLPNRAFLMEQLQQAMDDVGRRKRFGALLLLDIDGFKDYNDAQGFHAGDQMLLHIAEQLQACLPKDAILSRLGGDEFGILLPDISGVRLKTAAISGSLAERLMQALEQKLPDYEARASIGLVIFCGNETSAAERLHDAEMAMYQAKRKGGGSLQFFDEALKQAISERAILERELRQGIANGELELYYQPQIEHRAGQDVTVGAEALVRWNHPVRGLVSPAVFIPLAEETGLILPLGHWVLQEACRQLAAWQTNPQTADLALAVNVSAAQYLEENFVEAFKTLLHETGVRADRLKLELTESLLVDKPDAVIQTMQALRLLGCKFSLDDFGTGYSSLAYLKRLPLDQLKIDQSFVRDMETDANDVAIANSVVVLAKSLGLNVIAEGVETEVQRKLLAEMGCHSWQGYYFSRPLPLEAFEAFLHRNFDDD